MWKDYAPNLQYLKVWDCLAKVLLLEPRKRKIGSKTFNYMSMGYARNSVAYRFLILKSDVLECNIVIEKKNAKFFKHIYPLCDKISYIIRPLNTLLSNSKQINEILIGKRQKNKTSFGHYFYTFIIDNDP